MPAKGWRRSLLTAGLALGLVAPVHGQELELAAEERERAFAAVSIPQEPVSRHLLAEHQMVLWLPTRWSAEQVGEGLAHFVAKEPEIKLQAGRRKFQPGASILQTAENFLAALSDANQPVEVISRRRFRVIHRPALEITGRGRRGDTELQVRLLWVSDVEPTSYRFFRLEGEDGEALDQTLRRLLRDFSPLEDGVWSAGFERLRRSLVTEEDGLAAERRHQLFAEIAAPQGVGRTDLETDLAALAAEQGAAFLADGPLHAHPRVRIATHEALDPLALPEMWRARFLAGALLDPDPAVRHHLARRLAAFDGKAPGLAELILEQVFDSDSDTARGAALQLFAASPSARRQTLLAATMARLGELPATSQVFVLHLFDSWGSAETVESRLRDAARRSRHERVRKLAARLLLERGEKEALAAARERLMAPLAAGDLPLSLAARGLAIFGSEADLERLRRAAQSLEAAQTEDKKLSRELIRARAVLSSAVNHLATLPLSTEAECAALTTLRQKSAAESQSWLEPRSRRLGCAEESSGELAHATVSRPGAVIAALIERLERLDVSPAQSQEILRAALGLVRDRLDFWAGDPFSIASTGLDLSAPLEVSWWAEGRDAEDPDEPRFGLSLGVGAGEISRLEDSLLRLGADTGELSSLASGLFVVQVAPLMPLALFAAWGDEREHVVAKDDDSASTTPPKRFITLLTHEPGAADEPERRSLLRLVLDGDDLATWSSTHLVPSPSRLVLEQRQTPMPGSIPKLEAVASRDVEDLTSRADIDLSGFLTLFARLRAEEGTEEGQSVAESMPAGLKLGLISDLRNVNLATRFELRGLSANWRAAATPGPGSPRAPAELLPEGTLAWLGLRLAKAPLAALLAEHREVLVEEMGEEDVAKLLAAAEMFQGELGAALVGLAEPGKEAADEAWKKRLVLYASVDAAAADRFLAKNWPKSQRFAGVKVHAVGKDAVVARLGSFVVWAFDREIFTALGKAPWFAGSTAYGEITAGAPAEAALLGGFDTELLAADLRRRLESHNGEGPALFLVDVLRALGRIRVQARLQGETLVGEFAVAARQQTSETPAPPGERLTGFTAGSVATAGFPADFERQPRVEVLELRFELPRGATDPGFSWSNERLEQQREAAGSYRFRSRAGLALPESNSLTLPITSPELAPFLRNERNLDLHSNTVRQQAEEIRGSEDDPAKIVRAIVRWTHTRLDYSVIRRSPRVEEILTKRRADCTEFTQLTIALARSLGIPARAVNGIHVGPGGAILHRWAEVYLDRWYEIDSTFGVVEVPAASLRLPGTDGNYLANLPGSRFTFERALTKTGEEITAATEP